MAEPEEVPPAPTYAQLAENALDAAQAFSNQDLMVKVNAQIAAAQVLALLELARQKRVANLLALAAYSSEHDGQRLYTGAGAAQQMRMDAAEELGYDVLSDEF